MYTLADGWPVFVKCRKCSRTVLTREVLKRLWTCPKCNYVSPLPYPERLKMLVDRLGSNTAICRIAFCELFEGIESVNPLSMEGFDEKLLLAKEGTGMLCGIIAGYAKIRGRLAILLVSDFDFLGGSLGSAEGEKICRSFEKAAEEKLPVVIVCCGGGARMQENLFALYQMLRTCAVIGRAQEEGVFYVSVFTNPTLGGITASYASIADFKIAEAGATIGFAGERVVESRMTTEEILLYRHSQTPEAKLEAGQIDTIAERGALRDAIAFALGEPNSSDSRMDKLFREKPFCICPRWTPDMVASKGTSNFRAVDELSVEFPVEEKAHGHEKQGVIELKKGQVAARFVATGVFYRGMKPGEILAREGDRVKSGQAIGVHEAMKVFSYIPAPCNGVVVRFVVNNGSVLAKDEVVCIIRATR